MPAAFSRERRQQNRPASRKFHSVRRVSGQKETLARLINRKPIFRSLKNAVNIYTAYQSRILPRLAARRPPLQHPEGRLRPLSHAPIVPPSVGQGGLPYAAICFRRSASGGRWEKHTS